MFIKLHRVALALTGALVATACAMHGGMSISSVPPVAGVSGVAAPFGVARIAGDDLQDGLAGFHAMSVTLTKSLVSDDGYLIADYARHYGIRTIFLPIAGEDIPNLLARNRTTVANLDALFDTCTVYMVAGSESWLAEPGRVPQDARILSQRIGPMYPRFAGILYDIEPQTLRSWDPSRQQTIDRYFMLLDTLLKGRNASTFRRTLLSTVPAFARQLNRAGGSSPTMLQALESYDAVGGTYLLMAGDSASAELERAKPAFPEMKKPYFAIANTSPYSGQNGYSGKSASYLTSNMLALATGARAANSNFQAVDVSSWDDRFTSLQSILVQPTPAPIPEPTGPLVPKRGTDYIGAYVAPNDTPPGPATIAAFESQIGRTLAYDIHYPHWDGNFPGAAEEDDVANGRIPLESWHCGDSNARIAAGKDDALIKARADALRAFAHPVFLRYEWEMNLNARTEVRKPCYDPKTDLPTGLFSPTYYVAAWRRIHAIFAAEGATKVVWLWNPGAGGPDPAQYYPGESQVDWVGLDSYDRVDLPFETTFVPYLDDLAQFRKPMMVTETGAIDGNQAAFFATSEQTLRVRFPLVRGFSYLDSKSEVNWSLTGAGIEGFKALAHSKLMSARPPR